MFKRKDSRACLSRTAAQVLHQQLHPEEVQKALQEWVEARSLQIAKEAVGLKSAAELHQCQGKLALLDELEKLSEELKAELKQPAGKSWLIKG